MSLLLDVHIHQSYIFALSLSKKYCRSGFVLFILHTKNLACNKKKSKPISHLCLDCFAMAEQGESGTNNHLNTFVTLSLQMLHKIGPKVPIVKYSFFPLTKITAVFLYYSVLLEPCVTWYLSASQRFFI